MGSDVLRTRGIYDDTYQNDGQISDEFKDDCRVLPNDRLSTILNDAVVINLKRNCLNYKSSVKIVEIW